MKGECCQQAGEVVVAVVGTGVGSGERPDGDCTFGSGEKREGRDRRAQNMSRRNLWNVGGLLVLRAHMTPERRQLDSRMQSCTRTNTLGHFGRYFFY